MTVMSWPFQEAKRVSQHISHKKESQPAIVFQTGYGPSGLPHIGTFAEVARTSFVIEAFKQQNPDAKVKLIVFSDDMDGLRSLPSNIPNHELLKEHLGAPLSSIPDPFGETESFSSYMNTKLKFFLDEYGFDYSFQSSTDAYKSGVFNEGLKRIMDCYEGVRNLFINTIAKEKRSLWSPFFPICEKCGKIYTTRVTEIHTDSYELSYCCDKDDENY